MKSVNNSIKCSNQLQWLADHRSWLKSQTWRVLCKNHKKSDGPFPSKTHSISWTVIPAFRLSIGLVYIHACIVGTNLRNKKPCLFLAKTNEVNLLLKLGRKMSADDGKNTIISFPHGQWSDLRNTPCSPHTMSLSPPYQYVEHADLSLHSWKETLTKWSSHQTWLGNNQGYTKSSRRLI